MTNKRTFVTGFKTPKPENWELMTVEERVACNWRAYSFRGTGFWSNEAIVRRAEKAGFVGKITFAHTKMNAGGSGVHIDSARDTISL